MCTLMEEAASWYGAVFEVNERGNLTGQRYRDEVLRPVVEPFLRQQPRGTLLQQDKGRKEMFYLTTHSTHFIYGYMASDIL